MLKFDFLLKSLIEPINLFIGSIFFFVSINFIEFKSINLFKDLIPPPTRIDKFSMGFRYQFADLLWIRAIQDMDYCEEQKSDKVCKGNSWLFKMFDAITNLDPDFQTVYYNGSLALSVLISDIEGASLIFDKGTAKFPNDWRLNYYGGYHALAEEKNKQKAAERFERAAANGAPNWLYVTAGTLYNESGETEVTKKIIELLKGSEENSNLVERLEGKIKSK